MAVRSESIIVHLLLIHVRLVYGILVTKDKGIDPLNAIDFALSRSHLLSSPNMHEHVADNTSSYALVAALQGAFENNSIGVGSTKSACASARTRARRQLRKKKKKAVVPIEVSKFAYLLLIHVRCCSLGLRPPGVHM